MSAPKIGTTRNECCAKPSFLTNIVQHFCNAFATDSQALDVLVISTQPAQVEIICI